MLSLRSFARFGSAMSVMVFLHLGSYFRCRGEASVGWQLAFGSWYFAVWFDVIDVGAGLRALGQLDVDAQLWAAGQRCLGESNGSVWLGGVRA